MRPAWIACSLLLSLLLVGGYLAGRPGPLRPNNDGPVAHEVPTSAGVVLTPVIPSAAPSADTPAVPSPLPSLALDNHRKRPNATFGRPLGRPNANREAAPATVRSANPSALQANFDTSNPYE